MKKYQQDIARIIAKCWSDPQFKKRLMSAPEETLKAEGISLPKGVHLEVHEEKSDTFHLIIPQKPETEMSEEQLTQYAAGQVASCVVLSGGE